MCNLVFRTPVRALHGSALAFLSNLRSTSLCSRGNRRGFRPICFSLLLPTRGRSDDRDWDRRQEWAQQLMEVSNRMSPKVGGLTFWQPGGVPEVISPAQFE